MGNLGFLLKLYNWYKRFISILKGEIVLGSKDVDAFDIQLALLKKGYNVRITGILDSQTREALKKYQAANGLEADGLFGPQTWAILGK